MNKKIMVKLGLFIAFAAVLFLGIKRFKTYDIWTAIRENNISYVQNYLNNGGDSNLAKTIPGKAAPIEGYTLLMEASRRGNAQIVALLIHHKADVNARNDLNKTPLLYAMEVGNLAAIKLLVEHKADINWDISVNSGTSSSANTPIALAIFYGHIEVVKFLLDHGARITNQCINLATHFNRPDIIHLLLERGAQVTQNDIDSAERRNQKALADLLRKHI